MPDFLEVMARASLERVREARAKESESELRRRAMAGEPAPRVVLSGDGFDLIAEIKFRSPSSGALGEASDGPFGDAAKRRGAEEQRNVEGRRGVAARARTYARAGAAVISVLTEPSQFEGSLDDLEAAARAVAVPVMRKDFLVDPYQVWEARASGAAGVLLIVRMLDDARLGEMLHVAAETGMFTLLEAFDESDMERALRTRTAAGDPVGFPKGRAANANASSPKGTGRVTHGDAAVTEPACEHAAARSADDGSARSAGGEVWIGVNTRDLATLEVVQSRLDRLARQIPEGTISVAESGIATSADAADAARAGYSLALIGTALMRAADPGALAASILRAGREAKRRSCACE